MELSIVIVNYEMGNHIIKCIDSIYKETKRIDFEIIVIDNSHSRKDCDLLKEKFPKIIIRFNGRNLGFSKACNQGIVLSSGKVILILNPDTLVLNGALEHSYAFISGDDNIGIVGCKLLNFDGTLQRSCRSFPSIWNLCSEALCLYKIFSKTKLFGSYYMSYFNYDSIKDVDVVMGAFMMMKKELIDTIGGFDEIFFMYSEETDLCYRAQKNNWKVKYYPNAHVKHRWGGASNDFTDELAIEMHRSLMKFCHKHHGGLYYGIEKNILFLGVLLRFCYYRFITFIINDDGCCRKKEKYASIMKAYIQGI